jgi:tRNA A22 N-methylase
MDKAAPPASAGTEKRRAPRIPKLDARLRAAADWVAPCQTCADIGCDHGRFGAVLLTEGRCRYLLAADVSGKALGKAEKRLAALGLLPRAALAAADGLDALAVLPHGRADTVCILGLGGDTMADILRRGGARLSGATLVLGPQTEAPLVRSAVWEIGYRIADERVADDGGRLYLLVRAVPAPAGAPPYTERELLLGPRLLEEMPPGWEPWLARRARLLTKAVEAMRGACRPEDSRLNAAQRELTYTREALRALETKKAYESEVEVR